MADETLAPMDVDVYENQFKPWLGGHRFRWADEHTQLGPPGIRMVPVRLREAFVHRARQRAITDEEERSLGLPGDEPEWNARDVYRPDR